MELWREVVETHGGGGFHASSSAKKIQNRPLRSRKDEII
jgi:hypothetical protein